MKNLKIGKKLIFGFGLVLLMMVGLIISAISAQMSTSEQIVNYATRTVPGVSDVWQMRRNMISMQRYMLIALAENDLGKIKDALDMLVAEETVVEQTLTSFAGYATADPGQVDFIKTTLPDSNTSMEQIKTLLLENNAESNARAYQIFTEQYKPLVDKMAAVLEQMGQDQSNQAQKQKQTADAAFLLGMGFLLSIALAAIIVTVVMVVLISRALVRPVKEIENAMSALAQGDFENAQVTYQSKDELGNLAEDIRKTIGRISFIIRDLGQGLTEIANGNFTATSADDTVYVGVFGRLSEETYQIIYKLSETLGQINQSADQVASGSDQVSSGAQALSQGATEQASSVEELTASITEVSNQVRLNAEHASKASSMSDNATSAVENSNAQMQQLMTSMYEINAKSTEIGKIIKTIEDIAFQTNILALNAAVEAARAGSAGKGFAVVADEVRNLAAKSAEAAQNTTVLIEGSIAAIHTGVSLAQATADALQGVVQGAHDTSEVIQQITQASAEQAQSITQITVGLDQISSVVQTNSATAEQSAAASEELSAQAQTLKRLISAFHLADTSAVAQR